MEICVKNWQKTTSKYHFERLFKPFTLSAKMEKDYSRWTNTEAEAIINIYKERRKEVFLPLFGGFGCCTVSFCSAGSRDKSASGTPNNQNHKTKTNIRQIEVLVHGPNQSLSLQLHKKCETKEVNRSFADYIWWMCCIAWRHWHGLTDRSSLCNFKIAWSHLFIRT